MKSKWMSTWDLIHFPNIYYWSYFEKITLVQKKKKKLYCIFFHTVACSAPKNYLKNIFS